MDPLWPKMTINVNCREDVMMIDQEESNACCNLYSNFDTKAIVSILRILYIPNIFFLKCTSARVWHPGPRNFASFWMVLVPVPEKFGPKKSTGTRKFSSQKKVPVSVPEKFGTVTLWQVLHSCLSYLNHARIGLVFLYVFFW